MGKSNRAVNKINELIKRGKIIRGKCSKCGKEKAEAHHPDYNNPLEIIWLCKKHHSEWHSNNKALNSDRGNYNAIYVREDLMKNIEKETIKISEKNNKLTSKTKVLEAILEDYFNIKKNELRRKN